MGASSAYDIQGPGVFTLLSAVGPTTGVPTVSTGIVGTTSLVGAWFRVHPDVTRPTFQAKLGTASAGATAASSGIIEYSQDGVTPLKTAPGSWQLSGTTDRVADGFAPSSSMQAVWPYMRANLQSLTPTTAQDTNASSIPTTGQPTLVVTVSGGLRF